MTQPPAVEKKVAMYGMGPMGAMFARNLARNGQEIFQ